jgi:hypothetical protein
MSARAEAIESAHDSRRQDRSRSPSRSSESEHAVAQHVRKVVKSGKREYRQMHLHIDSDGEEWQRTFRKTSREHFAM